jgi:signal transduction histidine kinase/DNA-binding response OmpR family regulator
MKRYSTFFLLVLSTLVLFSQSKVDSLEIELYKTNEDTTKVRLLLQLFDQYKFDSISKAKATVLKAMQLSTKTGHVPSQVMSNIKYAQYLRTRTKIDSAILMFNIGKELAEKENFKAGVSDALNGLAYIYLRKGNLKRALEYHQKNLELSIEMKNDLRMGWAYGGIGGVYSEMGEYTKAMENYVLSSRKHKELGNLTDYAINLSNIGMLQEKLDNYDIAKQYLIQSDSIAKIIKNNHIQTYVCYALGRLYNKTGDLEQAITYSKKALSGYEQAGRRNQASFVNHTLGTIYWKQQRYRDALEAFQKRMEMAKEIGDSVGISSAYKSIGDCYGKLNEHEKAKTNYLNALNVAIFNSNELGEMRAHDALARVYASEGDFDKAYQSKNQYAILRDSLYTKEKRELATEIEAKYQNEQKVKEIALLESEKELQALQLTKRINERNGIIAIAVFVLILAGLFYNQYRIKQKANLKLRELDRLKSNFFANISHEFRTPLTLIKGPIERLEQNPEENLSLANIKMIRRNTTRVLKLINQLLDLSKIDRGNLQLTPTEGDVYKCLRAATSSFNSHAAQLDIDYQVSIPKGTVWALFDRDKIDKIVYNLLSNAFKFSPAGAVISFRSFLDHAGLHIEVRDTGKGIPKDKLPYIFDRFYQVDGGMAREQEGTGIGLSLSKDLVDLMDGTLTVNSELNKGSFFKVLIPLQEIKTGSDRRVSDEANLPKPKSEARAIAKQHQDIRNVPSVLIVEDNPDMRHFIKEQLISYYKVFEATNGETGFRTSISQQPDLIVTDLMMPKLDGIELCKKLKTNVNTSHIPVIMLTAKAGIDNKIEGLETGADDYLTKPFNADELLARTKNLIEQRKNLRELFSRSENTIDPKKVTVTSIDQRFLQSLIDLLEDQYDNPEFGVPQIQLSLAMSKTHLHRKVKALTNEAPGELLRNFRLKRAAQLLSQKSDTVTQIAYAVGFNNLSYFAKCFKKRYGVAPSSY